MGKACVSGETFKSVVPCWRSGNKLLCQSQTMETRLGLLEWRVLEMPPLPSAITHHLSASTANSNA